MPHSIQNNSSAKHVTSHDLQPQAKVKETAKPQEVQKTHTTTTQHKHRSSSTASQNLKQITEPAQVQALSQKLKSLSSETLQSQAKALDSSLSETSVGKRRSRRSHRHSQSSPVNHLKTTIQSGEASVKAFEKLHKQPNVQNLKQLGTSLQKHEHDVEALISDLPGGKDAVESAKKSLNSNLKDQTFVKNLSDSPLIGKIVNSVADVQQAYDDIQVCHQKTTARNVAKATFSSTQAAASCMVAVTTGLVALGLVSLPVSAPILAAGAVIGGLALAFRKWLN